MPPFNIPLADYTDRLEEGFETAEEEFRILYMGDNPDGYCQKVRSIISEMAEQAEYSLDVNVHHADIDESVLEESKADETFRADAADIDASDNFYDSTITYHLLCNPSIDEDQTVIQKREDIVEETERVTRTKPIHEVC